GYQQQIRTASRSLNIDSETLIPLFVNQSVCGLFGSQYVPEEAVRSLGRFLLHHIKQNAIVRGPRHAGHPRYTEGEGFACAEIQHFQSVLPKSGRVGRIGQVLVIVTYFETSKPQKRMALG